MSGAGRALLAAIASLVATSAAAQRAPHPPDPPGSQLTVYLMTMGPGRLVWERFGHNAIWIHDPAASPDQAYNYGLFDFRQQNFVLRFIKGQMWYWMDGFPAETYVRTYRRDNRSVYLQELNLPPAARRELVQVKALPSGVRPPVRCDNPPVAVARTRSLS